MKPLGDFFGGSFHPALGDPIVSANPAKGGAKVAEAGAAVERIDEAVLAAERAQPAWGALGVDERFARLTRFKAALTERKDALADALVLEIGKLRSEANDEVNALLGRFDLVKELIEKDLVSGPLPGRREEHLVWHALGVVGVIGPFNYPLHLCHAHVVPALLLGNTVVVKPSELAPLAAHRYAEAAEAAGLPAGVLNVVHGRGESGARLASAKAVRGLCFTGSYPVGRTLTQLAVDRPELLLALEMGGKNAAIVLDDADLRQAAHELVVGGYLSAGQRCTATDRVLVHKKVVGRLLDLLLPMVQSLTVGDPEDPSVFHGPLASMRARDRFEAALRAAVAGGAEALVPGGRIDGGAFVRPSIHRLPAGRHDLPGYTDTELFGPDLSIEVIDDDDEAQAVLRAGPAGLSHAVFTASAERFKRILAGVHAGLVNYNRSTNLASPRLPFGGVGQSGNYRPAGSFAPRNVAYPVASQQNEIGVFQVHPKLAAHLPPVDLDQLEARHVQEEAEEAGRRLFREPRPMRMRLPAGGRMPKSEAWLSRLYAGDRVVADKKPAVFDHLRSAGPWLVSIDDQPLSVLDSMSQTATLCGGFAEDQLVKAYVEGSFGDTVLTNSAAAVESARAAYVEILQQNLSGFPHVTFTSSGAEANEKALAICRVRAKSPKATKILAFEGGFHGRTLTALQATYSPAKRGPFVFQGYEATFAPFPVWSEPDEDEPEAPPGFLAAAATTHDELPAYKELEDPLLNAEIDALLKIHTELKTGEYFACIIEPMQSEGGDRYATRRFFRALRLLTRFHGVPLVMDEVQTGFGLGGSFAWHTQFDLIDFRGRSDGPDLVTFAKRAQLGVVMSVFPDPEPQHPHAASLVRGKLHAEMVEGIWDAERIEGLVRPRLQALAKQFPDLVKSPRARGFAFAFDLPTEEALQAVIAQRFWRGAVVFAAGTKTARYRLSDTFYEEQIEELFTVIRQSLAWIVAHPGQKPPAWDDRPLPPLAVEKPGPEIRVTNVSREDALARIADLLEIERHVYEPARRTPEWEFRLALEHPDGSAVLAELVKPDGALELIGFAVAGPLELFKNVEGPDRDPMIGKHNTLYSNAITVAEAYQGFGLGRRIKQAQLEHALQLKTPDGRPRYHYVTGRNRVGHAVPMTRLNRIFGAHAVFVLYGQYRDPEGEALYYRIPLGPLAPEPELMKSFQRAEELDLASGVSAPFAEPPPSLYRARQTGLLYGPTVNKLTLMNYATPGMIRALEYVSALAPELPHVFLTNGRDETVDKSIRILRWHRQKASVVIGLEGGYVGHTTGAARSLSDPVVHGGGPAYFAWPRIPHPAVVGTEAAAKALEAAIAAAGGPDNVLGLFYEIVQERTGRTIPEAFWARLADLRRKTGIYLVAVETTTACYRSGRGPFVSGPRTLVPDILAWWGGAQTGYLHVSPKLFVKNPLTFVSTWDGDELSLIREQHQLRAARRLDVSRGVQAFEAALLSHPSLGLGLYRVIEGHDRADAIFAKLIEKKIRVRRYPGGRLALAPQLDRAEEAAEALRRALEELRP